MFSEKVEVNSIESQKQANGWLVWIEMSKIPLADTQWECYCDFRCFYDITAHKWIEDKNTASQKLDPLSALVGRLAHDFKNFPSMISPLAI